MRNTPSLQRRIALLLLIAGPVAGCIDSPAPEMTAVPESIVAATEANFFIPPIAEERPVGGNDPGEGSTCASNPSYFLLTDRFPADRPAQREVSDPTPPSSPLNQEVFFTFNTLIDTSVAESEDDLKIRVISYWLGQVNGTTHVVFDYEAETTTFRFVPHQAYEPGTRYRVEFDYRKLRDVDGRALCLERLSHPFWDEAHWMPFTTYERPNEDTPAGDEIVTDTKTPQVCSWSADQRISNPSGPWGVQSQRIFFRLRFSERIRMESVGVNPESGNYDKIHFAPYGDYLEDLTGYSVDRIACAREVDVEGIEQLLVTLHCEVEGPERPDATLQRATPYQLVVEPGIEDLSGNASTERWVSPPFQTSASWPIWDNLECGREYENELNDPTRTTEDASP